MKESYPLSAPSEEHVEIREAIREIVEEVRYPQEAHDALLATGFFAPQGPDEYGGTDRTFVAADVASDL